MNPDKPRTTKQNNSLQVLCRQYAEALNDGGLEKKVVLDLLKLDVPWTQDSVRDDLFNPISRAMYDKTSSQLDTKAIQMVYKVLDRDLAESFGITLPWPDIYSQSHESNP